MDGFLVNEIENHIDSSNQRDFMEDSAIALVFPWVYVVKVPWTPVRNVQVIN